MAGELTRVDGAALKRAVDDFRNTVQTMNNARNQLEQLITDLGGKWQGPASGAYADAHARWSAGFATCAQELNNLGDTTEQGTNIHLSAEDNRRAGNAAIQIPSISPLNLNA